MFSIHPFFSYMKWCVLKNSPTSKLHGMVFWGWYAVFFRPPGLKTQAIVSQYFTGFLQQWSHVVNVHTGRGDWVCYLLFSLKQSYLLIPGLSSALHKGPLALAQLLWLWSWWAGWMWKDVCLCAVSVCVCVWPVLGPSGTLVLNGNNPVM